MTNFPKRPVDEWVPLSAAVAVGGGVKHRIVAARGLLPAPGEGSGIDGIGPLGGDDGCVCSG